MSFYDDYRPPTVEDGLVGKMQIDTANYLLDKVNSGKIPQKVMFIGPSGVGKTTIATMVGSAAECQIIPINCSAQTGIDYVRDHILTGINYGSWDNPRKMYLLDEIHGLSKAAQNALLTPLESLNENILIYCATTEPEKVIDTLKSRFENFTLTTPSITELKQRASYLLQLVGYTIRGKEDLEQLAISCGGNVRSLDSLVESYVGGLDVSRMSVDELSVPLFDLITKKGVFSVSEGFDAASNISDYNALVVQLCYYAIKAIKGRNQSRYKLILDIFGDGLSSNMPPYVSFHHKLLAYIDMANYEYSKRAK